MPGRRRCLFIDLHFSRSVIARSVSDEAIHAFASRETDCFASLEMTAKHKPAFSRRDASESCVSFRALLEQRAQGRPGARCTRGPVCKWVLKNAHEHTGSAETLRPSLRNGFTAYLVLSPVSGLFCHRRLRILFRKLDARVAALGPHDFAVRFSHARQSRLSRPPHPTARS